MDMTDNKVQLVLLGVFLAAMLVSGGGCQQGNQSSDTLLDYRRTVLDNGMEVITLEDFSCPIVSVQVWYHVGSKNERADRQGFSHMFEHMMFRGTDRLGPMGHFGLINKVGGMCNAYEGFDRTVYVETLPAEQLALALWLEAERMTFLKIDAEAFATERKVVEEERRIQLNAPYGTLFEQLLDNIYTVHPYRWQPIGKISHLRAASVAELKDFWRQYYVPNNATLIIAGAVSHENAQALARQYFGWIPRYEEPNRVEVTEPRQRQRRSIVIKEQNAPAPQVHIVFRTVPLCDQDTTTLDLLTKILGGGKSSRLYRELVAEKQLTVGAEAMHLSLEQDSLFDISAVLPTGEEDANAVLGLMWRQLSRLRKERVSEGELLKAKNQTMRDMVTANLTIANKAHMLGRAAVECNDVSQANRWMDKIGSVTADDLLRVAGHYLSPERALEVKVIQGAREQDATLMAEVEPDTAAAAHGEAVSQPPGRGDLKRTDDYPRSPPISDAKTPRLTPDYSSEVLANGLKVIVVPTSEVPLITVQLGLLAGAWSEDKPGTASMAVQMLTKGTRLHSEAELVDWLETYAVSLSGEADMDTASIRMSCLTEQVERAMSLMGETALQPTFPADEFEKLRRQLLTVLTVRSGEPEYVADREFATYLYGEHPYSRTATGEVSHVKALSVNDLQKWWSEFARPDMAVLIMAGDISKSKALKLARKTFGGWRAAGEKPAIELVRLREPQETRIYLVDRPGSVQSQIRAGHLGITRRDERYFVSRIVSNYFGWSFNSRLNESIRVAKGLTYYVWGGYDTRRFAGEFAVGTFTRTESTPQMVSALIDEIARLREQPPSEKEIENSRSDILGSFLRGRETPQQIAGDLWLIESQNLGADYFDRWLDGIAEADSSNCQRLVADTVHPQRLVIVVVGEAEKLAEPLGKIAPVTVVGSQDKVEGPQ